MPVPFPTSDSLAEGAGWREVPEPPIPTVRSGCRRAPRVGRWTARLSRVDQARWTAAVAEAERVFASRGLHEDTASGRLWSLVTPRRRVLLHAEERPDEATLMVTVAWSPPRPWVAALAWLCLPTALVTTVVLLSRPSATAEWLAPLALVGLPVAVAVLVRAAEWIRLGATRWRIRRLLRVDASEEPAPVPSEALWADAMEVDDEPEPTRAILPQNIGLAEWLTAEEVEGLVGARPARIAPEDLRRAHRVVARATAERRRGVLLPDGFSEWRPRRTP